MIYEAPQETVTWKLSKCRDSEEHMVHCHITGDAPQLIAVCPSKEIARMVLLCVGEFAEHYPAMRAAVDKAAAL